MEKNHYFDLPTQVIFAEPGYDKWIEGIAYKNEVICACCGGIFTIADIYESAKENGFKNAIYPYEDWIDISNEILGDALPFGLMANPENNGIIEI